MFASEAANIVVCCVTERKAQQGKEKKRHLLDFSVGAVRTVM